MKNLFLSVISVLTISLAFAINGVENVSTYEIEEDLEFFSGDCGGCIAYADSRDNGNDRQLIKWNRDLNNCRANSPECLEDSFDHGNV